MHKLPVITKLIEPCKDCFIEFFIVTLFYICINQRCNLFIIIQISSRILVKLYLFAYIVCSHKLIEVCSAVCK